MLCSCSALFGAWFACLSGPLPRLEIGRIELNPVALGPVEETERDGWIPIDLVVYVGFGASSVGSYLCMVEGRARTDGIFLGTV